MCPLLTLVTLVPVRSRGICMLQDLRGIGAVIPRLSRYFFGYPSHRRRAQWYKQIPDTNDTIPATLKVCRIDRCWWFWEGSTRRCRGISWKLCVSAMFQRMAWVLGDIAPKNHTMIHACWFGRFQFMWTVSLSDVLVFPNFKIPSRNACSCPQESVFLVVVSSNEIHPSSE